MKKLSFFLITVTLFAFGSCKISYNTAYYKSNYAKLIDTSTISKGGVSITLSHMGLNEYFKPEYTHQFSVLWGSKQYLKSTRHTIINLFYQMTVYNVEITNNTNNVLSLANSRIALILPDAPEPVFALSKSEMAKMAKENELPCILFEMSQTQSAYPNVNTKLAREAIQNATFEIIKEKSIISRTTEVLPGMKVKGYLIFPYNEEKIISGTVSFIDIKSSTDEAGNTTLTSRFDYKITEAQIHVKREYSQEQRKYLEFIPISEEEYNTAQQQSSIK
ncbi:MAG: hypothetical protein LBR10_10830 [Prevotellaceae bacterium]|jgi:hypothetical protein|nr:hypothetical protein [Prevotellaceae bacterium]